MTEDERERLIASLRHIAAVYGPDMAAWAGPRLIQAAEALEERDGEQFLAFCVRHFAPARRGDLTDAELLSIIEFHPAIRNALASSPPAGEAS